MALPLTLSTLSLSAMPVKKYSIHSNISCTPTCGCQGIDLRTKGSGFRRQQCGLAKAHATTRAVAWYDEAQCRLGQCDDKGEEVCELAGQGRQENDRHGCQLEKEYHVTNAAML